MIRPMLNVAESEIEAEEQAALAGLLDFACPYNACSARAVTIGEVIERPCRVTDCRGPRKEDAMRILPPRPEVPELLADASILSGAASCHLRIPLGAGFSQMVAWWGDRQDLGQLRPEISYAT